MLHVWKVSGDELVAIPVEELSNVRMLKQRLQTLCGLPRFRQRLLVDSATLADNAILDCLNVQLVLLPFADVSAEQQPELTIAAAGGFVEDVEEMLQEPRDPDIAFCGFTAMHAACEHGHTGVVRLLLEADADKDKSDRHGRTPLWLASQDGHSEIVRLLLESGAKKDHKDHYKRTPLWVASLRAHLEVVKLLLDSGADTNIGDTYGRTPLWEAAQSGHTEVVRLLLQAHAVTDDWGDIYHRTPLCEAAQNGHATIVRLLLEAGAEKDQGDFFGSTPLSLATDHSHPDVVCLLSDSGSTATAHKGAS